MLVLATLALLGASPNTEVKLAAPGFQTVDVTREQAAYLSQAFATQLSKQNLAVVTAQDLVAVLGLERQKELLGCGDSNCMAELSGALGVDGLVVGMLAKTASGYRLNLKIVAPSDAAPLAIWSTRADDDAALVEAFRDAAPQLAADVRHALHRDLPPAPSHVAQLLTAGAGVALAVAGGVLIGLGQQHLAQLESGAGVQGNVHSYANEGKTYRGTGIALAAIGGAALVTGLLWTWLGWNRGAPTAALLPGGASFGFAGVFP